MAVKYVSFSKLDTFRKCPYSLNAKFVSSEATNFGEAIHLCISEFLKHGTDFEKTYEKAEKKYSLPESRREQSSECFEKALDFLAKAGVESENIITVESEDGEAKLFDKNFFEAPMAKTWGIRGAMDLAFIDNMGFLNIVDWKTGFSRQEDDLQLAMYALAARKKYGNTFPIKTSFVYLQQWSSVASSYWDDTSMLNSYEYIRELVESYLSLLKEKCSSYPRTPHKNCQYCVFKDECVPYKQQLEVISNRADWDIDISRENFGKIVQTYNKATAAAKAIEAISKKLKAAYEDILEKEGKPIIEDGRLFEINNKIRGYEYDNAVLVSRLHNELGMPAEEIFKAMKFVKTKMTEMSKDASDEVKEKIKEILDSSVTNISYSKELKVTIAKEKEDEKK